MNALLLHCCCGPCSTSSIEKLRELGYEPTLFFGNSNIFPPEEAVKRFKALQVVADHFSLNIVHHPYNHSNWLETVKGHAQDPEGGERCALCFAYNLREAAREASHLKIPFFTTTLTVSPHKKSPMIFKIGKHWHEFVAIDFKKKGGFQRSLELSRMLDLYRQDYCGCEFSRRAKEDSQP